MLLQHLGRLPPQVPPFAVHEVEDVAAQMLPDNWPEQHLDAFDDETPLSRQPPPLGAVEEAQAM